jgi:LacI family transcriptional regulator
VKSKRSTIADVAALAEVDRSVVSRVLNDSPHLKVRDETRARVLRAVEELEYRPNAMARSLRTAQAEAVGLVIPDFANPIYASIIAGAQRAATEHRQLLLTGSFGRGGLPAEHYVDLLANGRVDGLLLASPGGEHELADRLARTSGVSWMLINRRYAGARRWLVLNDERAAGMAVEHLASLGHERIAHLAGPTDADTAERRRQGYRHSMRELGLSIRGLEVRGDYTPEGGRRAMADLLARRPRPTAVFVANVAAAIGALAGAQDAGVRVPSELSVIAVHDLPLVEYLAPPLTTLRMPLEALGRRGIELLATTPVDEPVEEVLEGDIELVVRASTAPPAP